MSSTMHNVHVIRPEDPEHTAGDGLAVDLLDPSHHHAHVAGLSSNSGRQLLTERVGRAGHLGFPVLQCRSKSYLQTILPIKLFYLRVRPIQIKYINTNSLNRRF